MNRITHTSSKLMTLAAILFLSAAAVGQTMSAPTNTPTPHRHKSGL
jgi:hypothetical protein